MRLDLSPVERDLLRELLVREIGDLKSEVRRTLTSGYRDDLKEREAVIEGLIDRLGPGEGPSARQPPVAGGP